MSFETAVRELIRSELKEILPTLLQEPKEEYLNTRQVAELTGLSVGFFEVGRSMGASDRPPYHRIGRRIIYKRSEVEAWLEGRKRS